MPSLANMRTKAKEAGLMKLDRLIEKRQHIPTNDFPISLKELCERFEKLYTGCVNDVMRFKPNGVVVWDTSADVEASLWGGVMTATAITKGIRGAVIAGGIRDTKQILEQNFPVFYKYRVSNGSLGRCMITHYQTPVKIGKVTVRPGDIIMGDIDGVICIPREIAYEVLLRAEGIERNEVDIFSWVRQGDTISEIIDKGGYF